MSAALFAERPGRCPYQLFMLEGVRRGTGRVAPQKTLRSRLCNSFWRQLSVCQSVSGLNFERCFERRKAGQIDAEGGGLRVRTTQLRPAVFVPAGPESDRLPAGTVFGKTIAQKTGVRDTRNRNDAGKLTAFPPRKLKRHWDTSCPEQVVGKDQPLLKLVLTARDFGRNLTALVEEIQGQFEIPADGIK